MKFKNIVYALSTIAFLIFAAIQTYSTSFFKNKKIEYSFENIYEPSELTGKFKDISISSGGRLLNSPTFFDIRILNSGNIDIPKSDFETDIEFEFMGDDVELIKVTQVSQSNIAIKADVRIKDKKLIILPLLLNSDDTFSIRVLLNNETGKIRPKVRVIGMKGNITKLESNNKRSSQDYISIFFIVVSFIILGKFLANIIHSDGKLGFWDLLTSLFTMYVTALLLVLYTNYTRIFDSTFTAMFIVFLPAILSYILSYYHYASVVKTKTSRRITKQQSKAYKAFKNKDLP